VIFSLNIPTGRMNPADKHLFDPCRNNDNGLYECSQNKTLQSGILDHWSDILGLLLKQNGADILKDNPDNDAKIKDVLSYYVNFRSKYQTWDETLPPPLYYLLRENWLFI